MRPLFFILFVIVFAFPVFAGELKLVSGKFDQSQKITVTIMGENGKIKKTVKKIPINYMYTKTPKKLQKAKKIPVSIRSINDKNKMPYAFVISAETISACSSTTTRYIIDKFAKKIITKTERDTTTKIINNELYVVKNGKKFQKNP